MIAQVRERRRIEKPSKKSRINKIKTFLLLFVFNNIGAKTHTHFSLY